LCNVFKNSKLKLRVLNYEKILLTLEQIYCCVSRNTFADFRNPRCPQDRRTAFTCRTSRNRSVSSRNGSIVCRRSFSFYPFLFTRHPSFLWRSVVTPHSAFASLFSHNRVAPPLLMQVKVWWAEPTRLWLVPKIEETTPWETLQKHWGGV
jgi:hypothetical protein